MASDVENALEFAVDAVGLASSMLAAERKSAADPETVQITAAVAQARATLAVAVQLARLNEILADRLTGGGRG